MLEQKACSSRVELNLQDIHRLGHRDGSASTGSNAWLRLLNFMLWP